LITFDKCFINFDKLLIHFFINVDKLLINFYKHLLAFDNLFTNFDKLLINIDNFYVSFGSVIEGHINSVAGIHCELFSCYIPLGQHSTAFHGEIEAIRTTLRLLNLHQNKIEGAVVFSNSKAAILSAGSTETKISTEARDCQDLIRQLKANHKQIAPHWIPGYCQIAGNEQADVLVKKGAKITQTHIEKHPTALLNYI